MKKTNTACCALAQLSGLNNDTTKEELQKTIVKLTAERNETYIPGDSSGKGQTAIFVITTPNESKLENTLFSVGFVETTTFQRRLGYEKGNLKMFLKHL